MKWLRRYTNTQGPEHKYNKAVTQKIVEELRYTPTHVFIRIIGKRLWKNT